MNKIITISRQYGSGGREIGAKLADGTGISELNIKLMKLCLMDVAVQESKARILRKAAKDAVFSAE